MGKLLGWLHARAQAVLCLDYRYMSASDMTQNRTGFIIQGERISHANKMQIVHFKRRILSTEKKKSNIKHMQKCEQIFVSH